MPARQTIPVSTIPVSVYDAIDNTSLVDALNRLATGDSEFVCVRDALMETYYCTGNGPARREAARAALQTLRRLAR